MADAIGSKVVAWFLEDGAKIVYLGLVTSVAAKGGMEVLFAVSVNTLLRRHTYPLYSDSLYVVTNEDEWQWMQGDTLVHPNAGTLKVTASQKCLHLHVCL